MKIFDFLKRTKQKDVKKRSYAAARAGRLFGDFVQSNNSADSELRFTLEVMRNRSRELVRDNEFAKRYMSLLKTNVIGDHGFHLQVKARNEDNSLDRGGNTAVENAWKRWGKLGNTTADGRMSWYDCQRLAVETLARDGEVFIKKVTGQKYHDGFALQFIESDLIDHNKNETLQNGNEIRMGIELDKAHRPIAYYVANHHPNDKFFNTNVSKIHTRVPADEMIHVFMPNRTHQSRGEPFMVSAMSALKMLGAYREAEVIAARISASKMGVITTPTGDDFVGDGLENNETPVIEVEPASFFQLNAGQKLDPIDFDHPNSSYPEFESAMLRGISSGLNVSYASLSNDLSSVNYSSIRQGALDERDGYRSLQRFMIEHFAQPIFESWLESAMDFGELNLPSAKFGKFADNAMFRGRGWNWVDPLKEINASVIGLQNGILSMQDVAATYGRDVEETFSQISRDKEVAEQFGLSMAFEPFGQKLPVEAVVEGGNDGD